MTFTSFSVNVSSITIQTTNITLVNIVCSNNRTVALLVFDTANSNKDSYSYCSLVADYNPAISDTCVAIFGSYDQLVSFMGVMIVLGAMVVLISLVVMIVMGLQMKNSSGETNLGFLLSFVVGLFVIGLMIFVFSIALGGICAI